ncbi:Uncharacterized protein PBTT_09975 [Plasmodiophora brassicae]|uniref:Uncharacterized protein n=1 Tax=Plasmodiophora brassicae TaxID=37360 RepID=A0A3P3YN99_PLABS|nr:unnamed protein product [Plasmodiophora brassicae]
MGDEDALGAMEADIVPVFLPEKSLVKYGMKLSEDVGHSVAKHYFDTKAIQEECTALGFMCDFHAVRDRVHTWTQPSILVIKDDNGQYGENYFWAASEALVKHFDPTGSGSAGGDTGEPQESEAERLARVEREEQERLAEIKLLTYVEPDFRPRPWNSLGSDAEIDSQWVEGSRKRAPIAFQFLKARKNFGGKYQFDNFDEKDKQVISCNRQIDKTYDLRKTCLDGAFQSAEQTRDAAVQASNFRMVNSTTLYSAVEMSDADRAQAMESGDLLRVVKTARPLIQMAIEQNLTVDIFGDDLDIGGDGELPLGQKSEHVKFFNTFVDLTYSKNRRITAIDWDPQRPGSVAVSCALSGSEDERVDMAGRPQPSAVLVWNFNDLIHPEMILEAPDEVFVFRFNPKSPNIVVGGLANGQVVLWNTNNRRVVARSNDPQRDLDLDNGDHVGAQQIAHIDPHLLSYTERSHSRPVQDLQWLPAGFEVQKRGDLKTNGSEPYPVQFASLAGDDHLLFWDVRGDVTAQDQHDNDGDFRWTPVFTLDLNGFAPTCMHLAVDARNSAVFVNENGAIALGSWLPKKDAALDDIPPGVEASNTNVAVSAIFDAHSLSCHTLQVSPDFPDLILAVGDWTFTVFRIVDATKQLQRIFHSGCASDYLTGAVWCPNRPGVVITTKANGSLDIWDLCDQSHKPAAPEMMISSTEISYAQFRPVRYSGPAGNQLPIPYLAVGDSGGNLHIVQLPSNFTTKLSNEVQIMRTFYERESARFLYFKQLHGTTGGTMAGSDRKEPAKDASGEGVAPVRSAGEAADDDAAEKAYQEMLKAFKAKLGVAQ